MVLWLRDIENLYSPIMVDNSVLPENIDDVRSPGNLFKVYVGLSCRKKTAKRIEMLKRAIRKSVVTHMAYNKNTITCKCMICSALVEVCTLWVPSSLSHKDSQRSDKLAHFDKYFKRISLFLYNDWGLSWKFTTRVDLEDLVCMIHLA